MKEDPTTTAIARWEDLQGKVLALAKKEVDSRQPLRALLDQQQRELAAFEDQPGKPGCNWNQCRLFW